MNLIDKDALVAEIEKRKSELQSRIAELGTFESNTLGLFQEMDLYDDIISFINTLEVKEVDLEKEPASEDLEQAANEFGIRQGVELKPFAIKFFKVGVQWQKEQMMKDAIDAQVSYLANERTGMKHLRAELPMGTELDFGEKVKVIIIKE